MRGRRGHPAQQQQQSIEQLAGVRGGKGAADCFLAVSFAIWALRGASREIMLPKQISGSYFSVLLHALDGLLLIAAKCC
jgi:hypothetical protein